MPLDGNLQHSDIMRVSDFMYDSIRATAGSDPTPLRLGFSYPQADGGENVLIGGVDSQNGEPVTLTPANTSIPMSGRDGPGPATPTCANARRWAASSSTPRPPAAATCQPGRSAF